MSRLDQHVAGVQNKLALGRFVHALAWTTLGVAGAVLVGVLVFEIAQIYPPKPVIWMSSALAVAAIVALVWAIMRRPSKYDAAVAIDERLGLKEKFSTALYIRSNDDPFAAAAVRDAEQTAQNVSLHKRFPLEFPRLFLITVVIGLLALLIYSCMSPMDLLGREAHQKLIAKQMTEQEHAKAQVEKALAVVNAVPKAAQADDAIRNAKIDLQALLNNPIKDPGYANRSAKKALDQVAEALSKQMETNHEMVDAQNSAKMFRSVNPNSNETGPVADAQRAIAEGDYSKAVEQLKNAVNKFDKMDDKEQKKAAQQMSNLAQQLQQMAQNPQVQKQVQQQMQKMGLTQQQQQQMMKNMQAAAQGNQQAAQQLQQQAQQMMQQMNNGQGPTQQQQQQIQQMMQQMQAQMNNQAQAQQMAQAAQKMAQAMQQASAQQQGQQGQQGQQQQQASGQNQSQGQKGQSGQQQGQQQQANAQQGQGQQGQQQGQQGQQGGSQGMQDAMSQMQQQLDQMDAMAKDAQAMADAQQGALDAAEDAGDQLNDGDQNSKGDKVRYSKSTGKWKAGDINGKGEGMGGPGRGAGGQASRENAPFAVKHENAPSVDNGKGRILASSLIKDNAPKGEAKAELQNVMQAAEKDAADEVEEDRVSRQARNVVQEYFQTTTDDGK